MKPGTKYSHKYTYNVYANENRDTAEGISFVSHTVRQLRGLPGNGDVLDYTLNNGNKVQVILEEMYYNILSLTVEGSKKLETH